MSLLLALLFSLEPYSKVFPLRIPASRKAGESRWAPLPLAMGVTDGSSTGAFLVDPFRPETGGEPGWKPSGMIAPAAKIASDAQIVGWFGADFMGAAIMGFDPAAGTVTLWRSGTDPALVAEWAGKGAVSAPLDLLPDGRPVATVVVGGKPLRMLLTSPDRPALVRKSRVPTSAFDLAETNGMLDVVPYRGLTEVAAAGRRLDWMTVGAEEEDRFGEADGVMPIFEGVKGRFVLDMPNKRMLSFPQTRDERIASEISRAIRMGVSVKGNGLVVDGYTVGTKGWESVRGSSVLKLHRWGGDDTVRALRGEALEIGLKVLTYLRATGFDVTVQTGEKTGVVVSVPGPGTK